jgi:hypothetical protein
MRRLRWREVEEAATAMLKESHDYRVKNIMAHIRAAYDPAPSDDDHLY